jgi:hypothetical protein
MFTNFRVLFLPLAAVLLGAGSGSGQLSAGRGGKAIDPPGQRGGKGTTTKETDSAAIAKLVRQLGSADFRQRDRATKALAAIGLPALEALRKAARGDNAEAAQRARRLVEAIEDSLGGLLAYYRDLGLPLPPEDAKLVRFESGGRYILNDKLMPPTYFLGFLLQKGTKDRPALLLVGAEEVRLAPYQTAEAVKPKPELVKGIELPWWGRTTFEMNAGLALALQCQARGWDGLARKLWAASRKQDSGHHRGAFYQPANLPNRAAVAYLAWAYSGNELVRPDSDRARTARRMKALLAAEPRLDTGINRALLKSLEAALVPSKARLGTVGRLIDDLTEMCNAGRRYDEADPRYTRLARKGFAAVPALIEHLDDDRLTRSVKQGFNNFPTWNLRVRDVVSDLLQELAGEDVGQDWLQRQQGWAVEKADAQDWWDKARKFGEKAYYLKHVLPAGKKGGWPNSLMLDIIAERYPEHLPKLYRAILDERPKVQSWPVAEVVAKTSLSAQEKRNVFLYAARHKNLEHRRFALSHLQKLDPQQFMAILLATLEALPKTPTEPYWRCPEAAYALLVLGTDDPRAWMLLRKVARRSDVGLRMEFLNYMNRGDTEDGRRKERLDFLAAFLDDADAPDVKANPKMYDGPHAGFTFVRLTVRDLAAITIAAILGMPDQPDRNWTAKQWEGLRARVRQALKK